MPVQYVQNLNFEITAGTFKAVQVIAFGQKVWFPKSTVSIVGNRVVCAQQWIFQQKFPSRTHENSVPSEFKSPIPFVPRVVDPLLTVGAYQLGDEVFVLRLTRKNYRTGKRSPYALQMVTINGERLMLSDTVQRVDFKYTERAKVAKFELKPEHKMSIADQEAITIRYGYCLICSRGLEDATSVAMGIGPVCYQNMTGIKPSQRKRNLAIRRAQREQKLLRQEIDNQNVIATIM